MSIYSTPQQIWSDLTLFYKRIDYGNIGQIIDLSPTVKVVYSEGNPKFVDYHFKDHDHFLTRDYTPDDPQSASAPKQEQTVEWSITSYFQPSQQKRKISTEEAFVVLREHNVLLDEFLFDECAEVRTIAAKLLKEDESV